MSRNQEIGQKGEQIAVRFLKKKGYVIKDRNWRHRKSEIDIIAMDGDALIFIEVKARSDDFYGRPESFVTNRKRQLMIDAASYYMETNNHNWEIRFDVISVLFHNHMHQSIDHFKDAFFPGWE